MVRSSFPYLDIAKKGTSDTQQPRTADLRVDSRAENGKLQNIKLSLRIFVGSEKNQLGKGKDELRVLTWNRGI